MDLAGIARRLRALAPSAPRVRVGIWAGRVALPLLFAAFTLAVTAGFIYAFNLALLPTTAEELTFRAQRQCSAVHPEESPSWNGCVVTQRIPPSDGPVRFLVPAVAATAAGGALVLVAARFRPRALAPTLLVAAILAIGTNMVVEQRKRDLDELRAVPITVSPEPTPAPGGSD